MDKVWRFLKKTYLLPYNLTGLTGNSTLVKYLHIHTQQHNRSKGEPIQVSMNKEHGIVIQQKSERREILNTLQHK